MKNTTQLYFKKPLTLYIPFELSTPMTIIITWEVILSN